MYEIFIDILVVEISFKTLEALMNSHYLMGKLESETKLMIAFQLKYLSNTKDIQQSNEPFDDEFFIHIQHYFMLKTNSMSNFL